LPLIAIPKFFPYGAGIPPADLIVTMIIVNFMAALNLYGNVTGWGSISGPSGLRAPGEAFVLRIGHR